MQYTQKKNPLAPTSELEKNILQRNYNTERMNLKWMSMLTRI